jgi:sugar phosphate permease
VPAPSGPSPEPRATRTAAWRALASDVLLSRRSAIFWVFGAAYFLSQFFRSTNAVIAGDLSSEIGLTAAQLGLMTSLFYASFAAVQLPLGTGLDRYGPRLVTPALMLVAALGSLVFGTGHSFAQLAVGRALMGVGMAGVYMGSLKAFSQWFSARRFAMASGLLVALGAVGALSAAAPLAWVAQHLGWRAVFLWGTAVVAAAAVAVAVVTRNTPPGVPWEGRRSRGGLRMIFREPRFWGIALLDLALVGTLLSVQGLWGGPFLFDVLGLSQLGAGRVLLTMSGTALVGYVTSGWAADRFGVQRVLVGATLLFLSAQSLLVAVALGATPGLVRVAFPLFGLAGAYNVLCMAHARAVFPTAMTGRAVTAVNLFGIGGAALLQWGMGMVIDGFGRDAAGAYPPGAYAAAFAVTLGLGAVTLLVYVRLSYR